MSQFGNPICQKSKKIYVFRMSGRFVANSLVGLLTLWAIYSIVSNFVVVTVYFPFNLAIEQDIPYDRR